MRKLQTALAVILLIVAALVVAMAIEGCAADWNKPHPITPEPGLPCGRLYYVCQAGCCYHTDICRPGGWCAFGGLEPTTWGSGRDGGAEPAEPRMYRALSPEEARKAAPR